MDAPARLAARKGAWVFCMVLRRSWPCHCPTNGAACDSSEDVEPSGTVVGLPGRPPGGGSSQSNGVLRPPLFDGNRLAARQGQSPAPLNRNVFPFFQRTKEHP